MVEALYSRDGDLGAEIGREALAGRFQAVRSLTTGLVASLSPEDQLIQSMPEANPAKWHLAHTTWFFEAYVLARLQPGYVPFDDRFAEVFSATADSSGPHLPHDRRGLLSRPDAAEVARYRDQINAQVMHLIHQVPERNWAMAARLIQLCLTHERQHQEQILTDIKHAFWSSPLAPAYRANGHPAPAATCGPSRWFGHPGGPVEIGVERPNGAGSIFDTDTPRHSVHLAPFRLAGRPLTCGEYLAFVEGGGYANADLWLADGWEIAQAQGWRAPLYWERRNGQWWIFTLHGRRPLDPAEPVCHVSFYEADAFARWANRRLPTEVEWEAMAAGCPVTGNLLDGGHLHPATSCCVSDGPWQMFGDVWEWTASPFAPYPGYRAKGSAFPEGPARFMVNRMVIRGGSCCTPSDYIAPSTRHCLQPAARWQFTGIRLAEDA
ncbi:MAG TPA: ergothioneine biosynthesis protein EgtB [Azospirillaceae bacterium]|nr:ergothioneine biosynthesis protein EgtB [Azospirillaceae bacterium]